MKEIMRESPFGQLVRLATNNKYFKYPEEEANFTLPEAWVELMNNPDAVGGDGSANMNDTPFGATSPRSTSTGATARDDEEQPSTEKGAQEHTPSHAADGEPEPNLLTRLHNTLSIQAAEPNRVIALEKTKSIPIVPKKTKDGAILVDWYYTDDRANPHNWTNARRAATTIIICFYTFVVYTSSAIYTSSEQGIMRAFGVGEVKATLGLSLYVLGYGIGPLLFSPLSEIPRIGRNPVYIVTMFLFVIISIPTAFAPNYPGLMVLRFLQGLFGSPCLASGGASLGDLYSLVSLPYAMMAWVAAAYCGREYIRNSPAPRLPHEKTMHVANIP